jgi:hypothetical protein
MSEKLSLEHLLKLLLNKDLSSEEHRKIKEKIRNTSEFKKAKTIRLVIKKPVAKNSSVEEGGLDLYERE